jgi:riboflavin transporter FmnP
MNKITKRSDLIKLVVICGVFTALAYVCVCVFRIKVQFLTLDIKDAVITTAAMLINPIAGVAISLAVAFIEMITISDTMVYGFIMNFLSSATFSFVASLIYRQKKNLLGAVLGLLLAAASVTAVMMLANLLITPYFMKTTSKVVVSLIPKLLLPFNLTKAILNCSIVMIIYKPISTALTRAKLIKKTKGADTYHIGAKTLAVSFASAIILVLCFVIFFVVLNAEMLLFKIN